MSTVPPITVPMYHQNPSSFPKTDYVYSPSSRWYGYEIAPGIPLIPNMSRPTYRNRYASPGSLGEYRRRRSTASSEESFEESWYRRIKRIVRTNVTHIYRSTSTALSSVATSATTAVWNSATSPVSSAVPRTEDSSSIRKTLWFPLLFLLCATLFYYLLYGTDPPTDNFPVTLPPLLDSVDSLTSVLVGLTSPVVRLWGGAVWLATLFVNTLFMIPTFLVDIVSLFYGAGGDHFAGSQIFRDDSETTKVMSDELKSMRKSIELVDSRMDDFKKELDDHNKDINADSLRKIIELVDSRVDDVKKELDNHKKDTESLRMSLELVDSRVNDVQSEFDNRLRDFIEGNLKNFIERVETRLEEVENNDHDQINNAEEVRVRLKELEDRIKTMNVEITSSNRSPAVTIDSGNFHGDVVSTVRRLLEEYHADRTGKPDYALGSNGAAIASIRCTRPYNKQSGEYVLWGIFHWEYVNSPDIIIRPGFMPGECWAFEGANGYVAIQLAIPIYVTGFSMEHTPKELTPFGHIESAPKKFSVWGLTSLEDKEEEFLGRFEFQDNGRSLQSYDAIMIDRPFNLVELRVESNHGHPEYTCLYRFRVHGRPAG